MRAAIDRHGCRVFGDEPDAPARGRCPECGWPVRLHSDGAYHHKRAAPDDPAPPACPLRDQSHSRSDGEQWPVDRPAYALGLGTIRRCILDALDGYGLEELAYLFTPLAQYTLAELTGADSHTGEMTRQAVQRLLDMTPEERQRVRHALNWHSVTQMREIFNA